MYSKGTGYFCDERIVFTLKKKNPLAGISVGHENLKT
jgi:hypothetical protein